MKQINKEELESYYRSHPDSETCIFLGIKSKGTLYSYLKRLGIERKGRKGAIKKSTKVKLIV